MNAVPSMHAPAAGEAVELQSESEDSPDAS